MEDTNNINIARILESQREDMQRYLMRLTRGDVDLSEDLAQQAIVRTWLKAQQGTIDDLARYLTTVTLNVFRDHRKSMRIRQTPEISEDDGLLQEFTREADMLNGSMSAFSFKSSSPERMEAQEELEIILGHVMRLPPIHRKVLLLRIQNFSHLEIGERLGIGEGALKMRLYRAREALRASMEGFLPLPPKPDNEMLGA